MKKNLPPIAVGLMWFDRQEDYQAFLDVADDAADLPQTLDVFRQKTENGFRNLSSRGQCVPMKIKVDLAELLAFCRAADGKVNAKNRMAFINSKVAERVKSSFGP